MRGAVAEAEAALDGIGATGPLAARREALQARIYLARQRAELEALAETNPGLAWQRLGRLAREFPDAPELEALKAQLASMPGRLDVGGTPVGAEVWLGGERLGELPLQRAIEPGEHEVRLRHPGFGERRYPARVAPGGRLTLRVELPGD